MNPGLFAEWPALARVLGDHLWQSSLFALVAGVLALMLSRNQARMRYRLWLAASLKFLIPFSLLVRAGKFFAWHSGADPRLYSMMSEAGQPFTPIDATNSVLLPATVSSGAQWFPVILGGMWLGGAVVVLSIWWLRWRKTAAVMRQATPLQAGREVAMLRRMEAVAGARANTTILLSHDAVEPGVFGILRPVLLWPQEISGEMEDAHLESIIAHEVWHVRRRDNLAAAIHMLVEALFWFHPLVWWIGARLLNERERACDEAVLESGSARQVYAESILKTCAFCLGSRLACTSGVTGANLKKRIVQIMTQKVTTKLDFGRRALLSLAGVVAFALPIMLGMFDPARGRAAVSHSSLVEAALLSVDAANPGANASTLVSPGKPPKTKKCTKSARQKVAAAAKRNESSKDNVKEDK
jgi:beta-lactamase regulating signal transducer with metallopeptidase domain